mgnify:FL=1
MKNYKAETILNSSSFPEIWVSNLQEKHIDLLIERILFFMMDNKELSDLQWGNLIRFCEVISPHKSQVMFVLLTNLHKQLDCINSARMILLVNLLDRNFRVCKSFCPEGLNQFMFDNRIENDKLYNSLSKKMIKKTARK